MPTRPQPKTTRGTKPEWLNLPRRKCDNCGASYKPTRPNSRYCKIECTRQFHRHGGAFMKLKPELEKLVKRRFQELRNDLTAMIAGEVALILARHQPAEFAHISAELKELRALWIETESRFVQLSSRIDSVFALRNLRSEPTPPALQPASAKADGRRIPTRHPG